jgi:predicted HicB family RNase H-like nuclease
MSGFADREKKREGKGVAASMILDTAQGQAQPILKEDEKIVIVPKEKEEIRSKRVNLVVRPSVYAAAQRKCKKLNISMNECINQFLETWIKE